MLLENLKKARIEKKLTMEEMGRQLGISKTAYWKIEHGKTNISLTHARQIASILEVSKDIIFVQDELTK